MTDDPPPRDPRADKDRDLARQRKIAANGSDKAARRTVPQRKAMANREIRRTDRADLRTAALTDPGADTIAPDLAAEHGRKWKSWGSTRAADHREARTAERAYLDATAGDDPAGRRRAQAFRQDRWAEANGTPPHTPQTTEK